MSDHGNEVPTIGDGAKLACVLEVLAPKAGNVYPDNEFPDLAVSDFLACAMVCRRAFEAAGSNSVGDLVLAATRQSRAVCKSNANLGIILLLAPLARAAATLQSERTVESLRLHATSTLQDLQPADGPKVFEAIRLATAGGLGEVEEMDIQSAEPVELMDAMRAAVYRDQIAEEYCTGFSQTFDSVVPCLQQWIAHERDIIRGITRAQIHLLSERPDSLIARKCGRALAMEVCERAKDVQPQRESGSWQEFDRWLRADGNRRNPGTTADLIAAGLFVILLTDGLDDKQLEKLIEEI